ncbi:hypothetical protein ACFQUX_08650 [Pantoea stewartii]|nr:hypothetical protein [Pantoea stewartii]
MTAALSQGGYGLPVTRFSAPAFFTPAGASFCYRFTRLQADKAVS